MIAHTLLDAAWLGAVAAADYDLAGPVACRLLATGLNDVYRLESAGGAAILRVSRARREPEFGPAAYGFELALLRFLAARGVAVAEPLPRRDGADLGWIDAPEGRRACALFAVAAGEPMAPDDRGQARALGRLLGRLHLAADDFAPAARRHALDRRYLIDEPLRRLSACPLIPPGDLALAERVAALAGPALAALEGTGASYGVVHGDVWWKNAHAAGGRLTLFDFDYCGYGWRIGDLAALGANGRLHGRPVADEIVAALLDGYGERRRLGAAELTAMPALEGAVMLWALGVWVFYCDVLGAQWLSARLATARPGFESWLGRAGRG